MLRSLVRGSNCLVLHAMVSHKSLENSLSTPNATILFVDAPITLHVSLIAEDDFLRKIPVRFSTPNDQIFSLEMVRRREFLRQLNLVSTQMRTFIVKIGCTLLLKMSNDDGESNDGESMFLVSQATD